MSTSLVEEIAAKAATLPIEQQREVLQVVETLAAHSIKAKPPRRKLKGDLAHLRSSVTSEDIEEARREMWRGYMGEDFE